MPAKKLTAAKAKKILEEGKARGKKLTARQKKFFGAVAGGQTPIRSAKAKAKKKTSRKPKSSKRK